MKAWLLDKISSINDLHLSEVSDPVPQPDEVLLDIHFAALNPADRYLAEGAYPARPAFPHILGRDAVGTIARLGSDPSAQQTSKIAAAATNQSLGIGDLCLILRGDGGVSQPGTFAEKVAVPIDSIAPIPVGWSFEQAAGASLVYLTAFAALTQWGPLPPGLVLISGASGGVGIAAIQLARAMGHSVVALSRDAEKSARLLQIGADLVFNPADANWRKQLKAKARVDLIIDNVGGPILPDMIETLNENGKVSVVGRLAGPVPEFNTASLFFRRVKIGGVAVGSYSRPEARLAWNAILRLLKQHDARPVVDQIFSFENLPKAFARLAAGPLGKVLLRGV